MRIDRRLLSLSAQQVDPLSWFTGPLVPLVFASLNLLYGGGFAILSWDSSPAPVLQVAGVLASASACVLVHVLTRPLRRPIGWLGGAIAVLIGSTGFVLSALGFADAVVQIEVWWAPFGLALVIASLGPYLPARTVVALGFASAILTVPVAYLAVRDQVPHWGPVATCLIIAAPVVSAVVATAAFSISIVGRTLPLIAARSRTMLASDGPRDAAAQLAERERVTRLTARAVPFIEGVAASGRVTSADRTLAGQLARRLRDDLVTQSKLSWLDSVAGSRVVVVDPERRAGRMRGPQRTALRGLIRAILDLPGTDTGSLLVELRGHSDGTTAVGVSMDAELPEGRRVMHLAPYYLALGGSIDQLQWSDDRFLRLTFNLPAND